MLEAWAAERRRVTERWLSRSLVATLLALGGACAATGGTASPVLPMLFAPSVTTFAAFGRRRETAGMFALLVAVVVALAALPVGVPFEPLPMGVRRGLTVHFVVVSASLLVASVASLTDAFARQAATLDRMRETVIEESRARSRTLDAVGARVAHELKNPLTAIKGLVTLLGRKTTDTREQKRVAVIEGEVARMEEILAEWLTFSRPLEDLTLAPTDVATVARDVMAVLEGRAAAAGVSLRCETASVTCAIDARRMQAALLNLATNALDATPAGGGVECRVEPTAEGARVTVEDTGRGMSSDALERIGTAFYTTREGGTGLGVLLARVAIEQHGGTLRYESEEVRGTRAIVEIPTKGSR